MTFRRSVPWAALCAALLPSALAAEPWEQVAQLPGGIALEPDLASVSTGLDGERRVAVGTFRKQLPSGLMESSVTVDCRANEARIRRVRLFDGERVTADNILAGASFAPVNEGSAEAFYAAALCAPAEEEAAPE